VPDWYLDSFRDMRSFPEVKDTNDDKEFTQMIKAIKVRHNNVVPMMALGVQRLKKGMDLKIVCENLDEIHQFLDRFYMSRLGIRMLIGQHVELHNPNPPHCVCCIHTKMSPVEVARNASEDACAMCLEYGSSPDVNIYGDPTFTFPYVPAHLQLMVFELLKNSLPVVQERYMDSDKVSPPVRIIVADGIEDVTIKVSDEGGGIPRSGLPNIFTYLYSTAQYPLDEHSNLGTSEAATMAGYGYGIPISRLYAWYFGGDLQIISTEGYGASLGAFTCGAWSEPHDVLGVVDDTDTIYFINTNGEEITRITKKHFKGSASVIGLIMQDDIDAQRSYFFTVLTSDGLLHHVEISQEPSASISTSTSSASLAVNTLFPQIVFCFDYYPERSLLVVVGSAVSLNTIG
ncbi:LOW QUALITY PROTEIN: HATPase_c domain-containing protein/BCDHK_Adom3 domain-containing protein, partial [Cephalotus follicularis]